MKKVKSTHKNQAAAVDILVVSAGVLLLAGIMFAAFWSVERFELVRQKTQALLQIYDTAGRPVTQQLENLDVNSCHDLLLNMMGKGLDVVIEGRAINNGAQMVNACRWNPNPEVTFWKDKKSL